MPCGSGCGCGPRRSTSTSRGRGKRGGGRSSGGRSSGGSSSSCGPGGCRPSQASSRSKSTARKPAARSKSRGGSCGGCSCGCKSQSRGRNKSKSFPSDNRKRSSSRKSKDRGSRGRVVPIWKHLGPEPDLQKLFEEYDQKYFWGVLTSHKVTVEWSKRLKSTVGSCSADYPPTIRISEPLIRLRTNRDLVETLLHEMIHAFLELNDEEYEYEEHGPNFHKHMRRIDKLTGTRLTVDHNFHKEVELNQYQWQCNGKCRRIILHCYNKPPGPTDSWWEQHLQDCGGKFVLSSKPIFKNDSKSDKPSVRSPLSNIGNKTT